MSDEIIKVLDALAAKFGFAFDWTSSNVIPYLQTLCGKYVNYEIATSVIWMLIGAALCIVSVFLLKTFKSDNYVDPFILTGTIVIFLTGIIIIITQTFDIVTCLTFPEKVIVDAISILL